MFKGTKNKIKAVLKNKKAIDPVLVAIQNLKNTNQRKKELIKENSFRRWIPFMDKKQTNFN